MSKPVHKIEMGALRCMEQYHWPGNVRELENAIERAVALEKHDQITAWSLPEAMIRSVGADNVAVARAAASGGEQAQAISVPAEGLDLVQHISQLDAVTSRPR